MSPWEVRRLADVVSAVMTGADPGHPVLVGVDGRSASGKSTLAARVADTLGGAVVHTDDLAWHFSTFGWDDLLGTAVLDPLKAAHAVDLVPPGWAARGRPGAVRLPRGLPAVVIEGVGACRAGLAGRYDLSLWVETDPQVCHQREQARCAAGTTDPEVSAQWLAEERPWLAGQRPWDHVDAWVSGSPVDSHQALAEDSVLIRAMRPHTAPVATYD